MRAFPWWFWLVMAGVHFWRVTAPAALALLLLGWYGASSLGQLRWIAFGAGTVLTLPFLVSALMYAVQSIVTARHWRTLDHTETVAGVPLPAGSRVHFADTAHTKFISVDLPGVTEILGVRFLGHLARYDTWDDAGPVWSGQLAEDQIVDGIPCRAGYFGFDKFGTILGLNGTVHKFGLAADHEFFGLKFPRGTAIRRGDAKQPWRFLLPADKDVFVPLLATTAPGGVTLEITTDGRLDNIGSGHGQVIMLRGLPLNSKQFRLEGQEVISELAEPADIAGERWPAGTGVAVDLTTGAAAARPT